MSVVSRLASVVAGRSKLTVAVTLVLLAGLAVGAASIPSADGGSLQVNSTAEQKLDYIVDNYPVGGSNQTVYAVYVRDGDGDVLDRDSLRRSLEFHRRVTDNETVGGVIREDGQTASIAVAVTSQLTGNPAASYEKRFTALERADADQIDEIERELLSAESRALQLMPNSYEPGTATATGRRIVFVVPDDSLASEDSGGATAERLGEVLFAELPATAESDYFMLSGPAGDGTFSRVNQDILELTGPIALLVMILTMIVAYRDLGDILVGLFGVLSSLVATAGLMGWLSIPFGTAGTIAVILIIGLSIDYSFHIFMRFRENHEPGEGRRGPMRRALSAVGVALALVTVTTAVGFLSNVTNPLSDVRNLTAAMSLGIVATFLVFVTLVPAAKLELDGLRTRFLSGPDNQPVGNGDRVAGVLTAGVSAARLSAVAVVVVAVVAGAGGVFAWTQLDQSLQTGISEPDDWSQELPEPLGVEQYPFLENRAYVEETYLSSDPESRPTQILIQGSVADPEALERLDESREAAAESPVAFRRQGGLAETTGPLTEMRRVADESDRFGDVFERADTDDDGVPEQNVTGVYDAFYRVAPDTAASVVEREGDEYRSLRLVVETEQTSDAVVVDNTIRETVQPVGELDGVGAYVTGRQSITAALLRAVIGSVFQTVVVSLVAVLLLLALVYRVVEGSALLGVIAFVPVALVVALISLGMLLLGVPITLFTALMIGLVIGLGVDYSIHVTDRFADEVTGDDEPFDALERSLRGTGGALLGSTITTVSVFGTLAISPFDQTSNIGSVVGLALVGAFLASVFVLPSLLALWHRLHE
ncbi:RND family transporter [Halobaculum sp. MBLA0143]|uniref:efflux RND transporter permease subunit n=1 Tax=Halobaculum sp. MBLA0143 TaxID=3079933 RepID=UPI003525A48E